MRWKGERAGLAQGGGGVGGATGPRLARPLRVGTLGCCGGRKGPSLAKGLGGHGAQCDPPAESPSSAELDARYGSRGLPQACLGLVAGSNLLGPEGGPPISSPGLRGAETRAGAKIRSGRPHPSPSASPANGVPHDGRETLEKWGEERQGRGAKVSKTLGISCLTGKGAPCGWAELGRACWPSWLRSSSLLPAQVSKPVARLTSTPSLPARSSTSSLCPSNPSH